MLYICVYSVVWSWITECHLPGWWSWYPPSLPSVTCVPISPKCFSSAQDPLWVHTSTNLFINDSIEFFLFVLSLNLHNMPRSSLVTDYLSSFYECGNWASHAECWHHLKASSSPRLVLPPAMLVRDSHVSWNFSFALLWPLLVPAS